MDREAQTGVDAGVARGHGDERRRPPLLIGGRVLMWARLHPAATCSTCGRGPLRDSYHVPPGDAPPASDVDRTRLVLCEECAVKRAQGSSGTAVVEGGEYRCRVVSWDPELADQIELAVDGLLARSNRDEARSARRTVAIDDFHPERGQSDPGRRDAGG